MAATATQQIINNGPRNLVLKYTISGTTGDASAETLVDISALDASLFGSASLRLDRAQWALTGFSCKLLWDASTDLDLLELTAGEGVVDFSDVGGLTNNASFPTGDVLFTTTGYEASGEGGHIFLEFKKKSITAGDTGHDAEVSVGSLTFTGAAPTITVA